MRYMLTLFAVGVLMLTLQGCETFRGATDGLQKDIASFQSKDNELYKTDAWLQEHLW